MQIDARNELVISVITVVFNGQDTIEPTIHSVINQTYNHIEYLIIDGGSTDDTLNIIRKYSNQCQWISEKDNGIFDAMNKGLALATGDWIVFMNAGDMFFDNRVLETIFSRSDIVNYDMIYGDVCLFSSTDEYYFKSKTNSVKINLNAICHQSVFIRLAKHPLFDLQYTLSADHDLIYNFVKNKKVLYFDTTVSRILIGGVSSDLKATRKQKLRISIKRGGVADVLIALVFYAYGVLKDYSKRYLLRFFPPEVFKKIRSIKNKMEQV